MIRQDLCFCTCVWTLAASNGQGMLLRQGSLQDRNTAGSWKGFRLISQRHSGLPRTGISEDFHCAKQRNLKSFRESGILRNLGFRGTKTLLPEDSGSYPQNQSCTNEKVCRKKNFRCHSRSPKKLSHELSTKILSSKLPYAANQAACKSSPVSL